MCVKLQPQRICIKKVLINAKEVLLWFVVTTKRTCSSRTPSFLVHGFMLYKHVLVHEVESVRSVITLLTLTDTQYLRHALTLSIEVAIFILKRLHENIFYFSYLSSFMILDLFWLLKSVFRIRSDPDPLKETLILINLHTNQPKL